jgi:hypothetical protein
MQLDVVRVWVGVEEGLRVRLAVEEVVVVGVLEAVADRVGVSVDVSVDVAVGAIGCLESRKKYNSYAAFFNLKKSKEQINL